MVLGSIGQLRSRAYPSPSRGCVQKMDTRGTLTSLELHELPLWLKIIYLRSLDMTIVELAAMYMLSPMNVRRIIRGEMMPEGFWLKGVQSKQRRINGSNPNSNNLP